MPSICGLALRLAGVISDPRDRIFLAEGAELALRSLAPCCLGTGL